MKAFLQKGFTLIELMIVVAIIGILASIMMPMWQVYVARAQFVEGLSILNGFKPALVEGVANGAGCAHNVYWRGDMPKTTKYLKDTGVDTGFPYCRLWAQFQANKNSKLLRNKSVCLTYNRNTNEWICGTNVDAEVRPSTCVPSACHGSPIKWEGY